MKLLLPRVSLDGRFIGGLKIENSRMIVSFIRWMIILGIFVYAIVQRLAYPPYPFCALDTGGFLLPALTALSGEGFIHVNLRPFPYPLFIYCILFIFKSFKAIAVVQHILGLIGGMILWKSWQNLKYFIRDSNLLHFIHETMGFLLLFLYLLSPGVMMYEHKIMSETYFNASETGFIHEFKQFIVKHV